MCSNGRNPGDPLKITLDMLVVAAVLDGQKDEEGKFQPFAFTFEALGTYLEAVHGIDKQQTRYLEQTVKWLLKDHGLHEFKIGGKFYYSMPRHSMDAFERMMGYHPDVILLG